ncbi:MAG: response regulator [Bacteroidota bacterium]
MAKLLMPSILLIEDNLSIRDSMAEILELSGYKIFKASNGKAGLTMAREKMPDLIICDVMMPELDGFGVLSLLAKDPNTQNIPFIFLTSKMEGHDLRKGMNLGADDYLTKPFELSELLQTIELRLQKANARQVPLQKQTVSSPNNSVEKYQKQFEAWTQQFEERIFSPNQILFDAGRHPIFLYYLTSGIAILQQEASLDRAFIRQLQCPPSLLGFEAFCSQQAHSEQAIALNQVRARPIAVKDFNQYLQNEPQLMRYFLQLLAANSLAQQKLQAAYAFASVRKKVALSLLRIHKLIGDQEIDLSRERLASFACVSRGALMRVLAEFREDALISTENTKLSILDVDSLDFISD